MELVPLFAVRETVDPRLNILKYETQVEAKSGIIVQYNPTGKIGLSLVSCVHEGGIVTVAMRMAVLPPVVKYNVGEVVAYFLQLS